MTHPHFEGDTRSNRERMAAGDLYMADPELKQLHIKAKQLAEKYRQADIAADLGARQILTELLGGLGEGSVVVKDIPANVVAVGNPAKPVKNV